MEHPEWTRSWDCARIWCDRLGSVWQRIQHFLKAFLEDLFYTGGKGSGYLDNMLSGSFKLTKDTSALYCSVRYGIVLSSSPEVWITIGMDPHLFGFPGSGYASGMRIRIQGHGNLPKFKNKPGFLPFKKAFFHS